MTRAIIALADLVLQKMPTDLPINIPAFMGSSLMAGVHDNYAPDLYKEMTELMQQRRNGVRTFLLDEDYVETIDHTIQRDKITKKGKKAKELGGHEAYKKWEQEQEDKKIITKDMEQRIKELTLKNLEYEVENSGLKKELAEAQLSLSRAQEKDIPINAEDRKDNINWLAVSIIINILLSLLLIGRW